MILHLCPTPSLPGRVVILGGSGFVGCHMAKHLTAAGVEVVAPFSAEMDLCRPSAVETLGRAVRKDDALIFLSCITREKGDDVATFMKNVTMAQHVALFLEASGCAHIVYVGSDAIYPDRAVPIREDSECDPAGLYGLAHVVRERLLGYSAGKARVPLLVLRLCAVYGAGDTHNAYGPNRFLRSALGEGRIGLFGQGEEKRHHLYVGDVCRLIELGLAHRSAGVLNVAPPRAMAFAEVAATVGRVVMRPVDVQSLPRSGPITHRHFDVAGLFKAFPSFDFTSLEEGLRLTTKSFGPGGSR